MPRARVIRVTAGAVTGTLVAIVVALVCVRLGIWQVHRLQERRARNAGTVARMQAPPAALTAALMDSAGLLFRRVNITGVYDDDRTIIVAGRSYHGQPGVYVLTPVRVGGAGVLVNRGWMPSSDAANTNLEGTSEPAPQNVKGLVVELTRDPRPADSDTLPGFKRVWFHVSHAALQREFPYPIANYAVQILPSAGAPRLPRRIDMPALDEGPHLGYAIQWFSFAIIAIVGWGVVLRKRSTDDERRDDEMM